MVASAAVVVAASLVVERSGPVIGALVATLPISAGPAFAFLALDHSPEFLARSTLASLAVNAGTAPFILLYASLAQRFGLLVSLGAALLVWSGLAAALSVLAPGIGTAAALNALSYGGAYLLSHPYRRAARPVRAPARWWDLPARAATVMGLAATVVLAGRWLGPQAAGIAALLPVVLTSLVLVLHPRIGGPATAAVLANSIPGMVGFTTALAILHLTVVPLGSAAALLLALAICIGWNAGLLAMTLRSARRTRAGRSSSAR
ncbi:hypothetical protein HJG44_02315 [Enterovirga sp. DB1703]|uniref:DUF3147 family protein n=2 Tax=Enterovirga aerilata TaxID=2730920 RepID=A0A849I599_9HYPH|nr:hypothetical protein [Enterovirga sp. DB1703]NNM71227.1 hypothetical protein [Enterovirga sp. DB1703]